MALSLPALPPLFAPENVDFTMHGVKARSIECSFYKFPFQRLKFSIRKFQKMLEADFDRLEMHRNNIDKLTAAGDWVGLHKEQVNAARTVQQVKVTMGELKRVRSRVLEEEVDLFDKQAKDTKVKAVHAVHSFLRIPIATNQLPTGAEDEATPDRAVESEESTSHFDTIASPVTVPQTQIHVVPENSQAAVSAEDLLKDAAELYDLVLHFASVVKDHGEAANSEGESTTFMPADFGQRSLRNSKVPSLGYAVLPVMGAVIGGVIAGPAGLVVAGLHISGLAGVVGGGVAGLAGGTILKSRDKKSSTSKNSNSTQE